MEMLLLTLFKQHYLDQYSEGMKDCFSCLGYYDGISIACIEEKNEVFPMAEVWRKTGEQIRELSGRFSNQNIGLFRCNSSGKRWTDLEDWPFIVAGFIKIRESTKASKLYEAIEKKSIQDKDGRECEVLTYYTFDNADLILLAKGNSIGMLVAVLQQIEEMDEIIYLHSILGLDEGYLKSCKETGYVLDRWKGNRCFVDESIWKMNIQLATSGNGKVFDLFIDKLNFWQGWEKGDKSNNCIESGISYSYMTGHGNINIEILHSNVRMLIIFLLPEGLLTHQNGVYGHGLYNIETEIFMEEHMWKQAEKENIFGQGTNEVWKSWCNEEIEVCKEFCDKLPVLSEDDSLYAYFRVLIQTLNTLAQYECFSMSRDIFELIYPSFQMFMAQLFEYIQEKDIDKESLKKSLMQYLECVNSVVYHTIHTDQVYLMIPGYSGTSFSIPVKLSLFYSWYIEKVKDILNDDFRGSHRKYSCIIKPVMESRPITNMIRVNPEKRDILICVQLSQRSLFKPRELFIILAHELGHYVGTYARNRNLRKECITKTLAYWLAEAICSGPLNKNPLPGTEEICAQYIKEVKSELQLEIFGQLGSLLQTKFANDGHAKELESALELACREVISEDGAGSRICAIIESIPEKALNYFNKEDDISIRRIRLIYRLQEEMHQYRRALLNSQIVDMIIHDLMVAYKEVYADIVAAALLEYSADQYADAFEVSEGAKEKEHEQREQCLRKSVLEEILFSKHCNGPVGEPGKDDGSFDELYVNLYNYQWMREHLFQYAKDSYEKLKEAIQKKPEEVEAIRKAYKVLGKRGSSPGAMYLLIEESIRGYKESVEKIYSPGLGL